MFAIGTVYCVTIFSFIAAQLFGGGGDRLERGILSRSWPTAAVATGIAMLKILGTKTRTGAINEYDET